MLGKNTGVTCGFFNYDALINYRKRGVTNDPFWHPTGRDDVLSRGTNVYPKQDLTVVENQRTKTINPESRLFFDPSSTFPRFKLGLTDNKRCIKIPKADYIVVSGSNDFLLSSKEYVIIEDTDMYFVLADEGDTGFNSQLSTFVNQLRGYHTFSTDAKVIYRGKIQSYTKDSLYLGKYADGEYTVPYITDNDLDKICCNMCPEPTYEEFLSIIDMLDSDDGSIVQLGIKMLSGFNVEKYKLSFRLILQTRRNGYNGCRNLVACKQLMDTLEIASYQIYDGFAYGSTLCQRTGETYTVEDIAMAKKIAAKFIKQDVQEYVMNNYFRNSFIWLPDEKTISFT